jgi:hypothetical protein
MSEFADWATEALKEYEQRLYDDERAGEDTWFIRDQVLWELANRLANPAGEPENKPLKGRAFGAP